LVAKNSGVSTITTMAAVWRPEVLVKVDAPRPGGDWIG
jgi:hypothetical protein